MDQAKFIEVNAGVRYWEDALLNGEEDSEGRIPLRKGDYWSPVIELSTGRVLDWPEGHTADIHYKVCDDGEYWLLDEAGDRILKWKSDYVPNGILCVDDNGYGDYIIMTIGHDGKIVGWNEPSLEKEAWLPVQVPAVPK